MNENNAVGVTNVTDTQGDTFTLFEFAIMTGAVTAQYSSIVGAHASGQTVTVNFAANPTLSLMEVYQINGPGHSVVAHNAVAVNTLSPSCGPVLGVIYNPTGFNTTHPTSCTVSASQ